MMRDHEPSCAVWDWVSGERILNNAKTCSCGYRDYIARVRAETLAQHRPLRPLGMSDADFLRTLGIAPEES